MTNSQCGRKHDSGCIHIQYCDACSTLNALQTRITEAEKALVAMKDEECRLKSNVNAAHDPLRRLPPEIISHIFGGVRSGRPSYSSESRFTPSLQPFLTLGSVCRYWRHTAWSTPSLWNELDFFINPVEIPKNRSFATRVNIFNGCLTRSGELPLRIYIYWNDENGFDLEPADLEPLMRALQHPQVTARVVEAHFEIPEWCYSHLNNLTAPKVKDMVLETIGGEQGMGGPVVHLEAFTSNLEHLALNYMNLDRFTFSCENLTYLEILDGCPSSCIEILRHAKSLRSCHLELLDGPIPSAVNVPPAMQSQLVEVTLFYQGSSALGSFFEFFTFRALENLRIVSDSDQPSGAFQLLSFFNRSQCPLEELQLLAGEPWSLADLESLLDLIPTLTDLRLKQAPNGHSLAETFRMMFGHRTSTDADTSSRAAITGFTCASPWTAADSINRWSFIPEVFSRFKLDSSTRESPKDICIRLNITGEEQGDFWIPPDVIKAIQDLRSGDWGFFLSAHRGEQHTMDLVDASIRHYKRKGRQ